MRTAATIASGAVGSVCRIGWLTLAALSCAATALAQTPDAPLQLKNLGPAGAQNHVGETWGSLRFALSNRTAEDRQARLMTFYPGAEGRQYGRDSWVPAKATLWSWSCLGPPAAPPDKSLVELKSYLYDRTGGRDHLVRSPDGPPVHSELVRFQRREPGTTLMLDVDLADGSQNPVTSLDESRGREIRDLVRVFRHRASLSARVDPVKPHYLPPFAEALEGVQHFVLGSNRLADDVAGRRALREWLQRGGTLWVLLDRVEAETVAPFLGDVLDFQVVDRISLDKFHLRGVAETARRVEPEPTEREDPVDFVRVLAPRAQVLYTIDGWPAAFQTEVGRGRVLVTTLGARGWMRPRTDKDAKPRYLEFPSLPVALTPFDALSDELQPRPERPPFAADELRNYVSEQIGYSVVGRETVLLVFGLLFLGLAAATVGLSRKGLLEHLGWLGPALALGGAAVFIGLGERSRGAVPATVAMVQVIDAIPGQDEAQASGFLAAYRPALGDAPVGVEQGGSFDLDFSGLEGRDFRRLQTDLDRWQWENLELPAGVRLAPFRHTVRTEQPIEATVRFGPEGVEGRLTAGPFRRLEDALLTTPGQHALAVHLGDDGVFRAGSADELPPGQFLVGSLLSDQQRARQSLYANLFAEPQPRYVANRNLLLAWTDPVDLHFDLARQPRTTGAALVVVPLRFERTPSATPVTVPAAFVDARRLTADDQLLRPTTSGRDRSSLRLRFQVPGQVSPLKVERARLTLRLTAAAREVVIAGVAGAETVPLRRLSSPLGVEQIDIDDPRLLRPDDQGALYVDIAVGEARGAEQDTWRLESVGLEVRGKTVADGRREHESQ